jgi:hypothetical protein
MAVLRAAHQQPLGAFRPDILHLMSSELRPAGPRYRRLFTVPLGRAAEPAPETE